MKKEFTATCYLIDDDKVLLHKHPKLNKWLPPGGHVEENETPDVAAKREALEETGLIIELESDEHVWIEEENATSLPRPWMVLLENIPEHKSVPAHQHIDFVFRGKIIGGKMIEHSGFYFLTMDEIKKLYDQKELYLETFQTVKKLLLVPSMV